MTLCLLRPAGIASRLRYAGSVPGGVPCERLPGTAPIASLGARSRLSTPRGRSPACHRRGGPEGRRSGTPPRSPTPPTPLSPTHQCDGVMEPALIREIRVPFAMGASGGQRQRQKQQTAAATRVADPELLPHSRVKVVREVGPPHVAEDAEEVVGKFPHLRIERERLRIGERGSIDPAVQGEGQRQPV